jgi:hypothetical protein
MGLHPTSKQGKRLNLGMLLNDPDMMEHLATYIDATQD